MKNIWKKYKIGIIYGFYVILALALIFSVFFWMDKKIKETALLIQQKKADNEIFNERVFKLEEIEKEFGDYSQKMNETGVFLEEGREVDFIKRIEEIAESTGNSIELKIKEEQKEAKKNVANQLPEISSKEVSEIIKNSSKEKFMEFQVNLTGGYQNLFSFLRKIENAEYYLLITSLDVKKKQKGANNDSYSSQRNAFSFNDNIESKDVLEEVLFSTINITVYKK